MTTSQTGLTSRVQNNRIAAARSATRPNLALGVAAAALGVGVAVIHVMDQGGLTAVKDPAYVGYGYRVLEIVALVVAVALVVRSSRGRVVTWLLAAAVGAGPIAGYVLSRGPGMPNYTDDRGNWTEPLGLVSLAVEGLLVVLALVGARISSSRTAAVQRF